MPDFSLPRQHSLNHYFLMIRLFGAPNGLCSSITESKHIKAVKEPWRRSSRYKALGQMLLTNQRLDKIAAARSDFEARGMLQGSCVSDALRALKNRECSLYLRLFRFLTCNIQVVASFQTMTVTTMTTTNLRTRYRLFLTVCASTSDQISPSR